MPRPIDLMKERLVQWYGPAAPIAQLEKAQHFDITNVAKYAEDFGGKEMDEIEFAVPPWDFVYAEIDGTKRTISFAVHTYRTKDDFKAWEIRLHILTNTLAYRGTIAMSEAGIVRETAHWETWFWGKWVDAQRYDLPVNESYAELRNEVATLKQRRPDKADEIDQVMGALAGISVSEDDRRTFGKVIPDELALVFFLATMLANCKNVPAVATAVPPKLLRAQTKRGHVPVARWYRLMIDPMRKVIRHEATESGDHELTYERAFHICRGHLKTFTAERPLFGRVTGRFWWPMHARGNRAAGTVEKEYALKNPASA
jgi:hypothetical protein